MTRLQLTEHNGVYVCRARHLLVVGAKARSIGSIQQAGLPARRPRH